MNLCPTWGIRDTSAEAVYFIRRKRVPEWLFYLAVAVWPPLRRSVVGVRRIKFSPEAMDVVGSNLRSER